jgi:hypothetical protein
MVATGWVLCTGDAGLADAAAAMVFTSTAGVLSTAGAVSLTTAAGFVADLRCFIDPVSDGSLLFDLEDLEVRGFGVSAAVCFSVAAELSSALFCVFFEGLLNNMNVIKAH